MLKRERCFWLIALVIATAGLVHSSTIAKDSLARVEKELVDLRLEVQELTDDLEKSLIDLDAFAQDVEELKSFSETLRNYGIGEFEATAYAPFDNKSGMCNDGDPRRTATGTMPSRGTFAVNPRMFPYGTRMVVISKDGAEVGEALDTGGAMRKNPGLIDVYRDTYEEACAFGRQKVLVLYELDRE